jgi:hypothetical protein
VDPLHQLGNQVIDTPVAEYLPPRLVRDRVALAGDAARRQPDDRSGVPQRGAGRGRACRLPGQRADTADVPAGLARYQQERLPLARQLVSSGMSWGHSYLSSL